MKPKLSNNVELGPDYTIGDHVLLGAGSPALQKTGILRIGKNANIRSHTIIYLNTTIGDNFATGHGVLIRDDTIIGNNCLVGSHTIIEKSVKIGNNVTIQSAVYIPNLSVIEDNVFLGPRVCLTNDKYMIVSPDTPLKGPTIGKGTRIGANSTILPGVKIGPNCIIGAGSVVTKDIPANKVAYGNPAKVIRENK